MKKIATLLLTILTCILITGCSSNLENQRLANQVAREIERCDEYKSQVNELEAKNEELQAELDATYINLQDYKDEVEYLESLKENSGPVSSNNESIINEYKQQISNLEKQLENCSDTDLLATIDNLNSQIDSKNKEISNLQAQLNFAKNNSYSTSNNSTVAKLQNQINVLTLDLQNYKTLSETLRKQLDDQINVNKNQSIQSAYSSYVSIKFWSNGKNYYTKNTVWYSDSYCSKKLASQDIVIISPTIDRFEASNGYIVYCCMSNVGLVYTSSQPSLYYVEN